MTDSVNGRDSPVLDLFYAIIYDRTIAPLRLTARPMIDLRNIIDAMARVTPADDYPDADALAAALGLDMTYASLATMKQGNLLVRGARLLEGGPVHIVAALSPRRELFLSFEDSGLPYREIAGATFGAEQRLQQSRFSEGFAIVFHIDGLEFVITTDSPDSKVGAIFCIARDPGAATTERASAARNLTSDARRAPLVSRETALAIARLVLAALLGAEDLARRAPLLIVDGGDVWTIRAADEQEDAALMTIAKRDGAIVALAPAPT